MYNRANVTDGR